jgi:formylglycine-generating enzyme required for sulfatase activity
MNFRSFSYAFCAVFVLLLGGQSARAQSCATDLNDDGVVDGKDLAMILSAWGACPIVISSVAPLQGSVLGGTEITISGSGLSTVTAVTVGGAPCTNITVVSPRQIRATTPAGQVGTAEIVVTAGAGSESAPSEFIYMQQTITSIAPHAGFYGGGTAISISGSFLGNTTAVTIGGVPASDVQVVNENLVTAVAPAGSVGAVDVVIIGAKGSVTVPAGYTYVTVTTPSWATLIEAYPDPNVVQDPGLRSAIMLTGHSWRVRDSATQIEMVLIPPGTFQMGCSPSGYDCFPDEYPVHQVTLTQPLYLGRFELTQAQWMARMGTNPSHWQSANPYVPPSEMLNRPVERVSWSMSQDFLLATGMRLPTEAEWEFAYRAGTTTAFHSMPLAPNGTNLDGYAREIAWMYTQVCLGIPCSTRPVGLKAMNGFGLHDMSGNVWEWTSDWYQPNYYLTSPTEDPPGPVTGDTRVVRGGSYYSGSIAEESRHVRASRRGSRPAGSQEDDVGFRVARNP